MVGRRRPLTEIAGLGPFVLAEHVSGQRLVFARNPRYWRKDAAGTQLPYLDKLTVLIVPDQNTEALRLQTGEIDLMGSGEIRPEDYAAFRRIAEQGRLRLIDAGVGLDPNVLWFNLSPAGAANPRTAWFRQKAFRQAISCAVDRQGIVNTVHLGAAVPIYGPITPANRLWYSEPRSTCDRDPARARVLLASAGLTDRNGDGMLEDASGKPVRFSILTHRGHTIRERTVAVLQEQLRQVGLAVDVVALDRPGAVPALGEGRLRHHLFRRAIERDGPRAQSAVLAQLRQLSFLEPGAAGAGDRMGAPHRRAVPAAGGGPASPRAPAAGHRGRAHSGGRDAGNLLRRPQGHARGQLAGRRTRGRPRRFRSSCGADTLAVAGQGR